MLDHDIFGRALIAFKRGEKVDLLLNNSYGEPEFMPLDIFFRTEEELSLLESKALDLCKGHTLDIGAGAGALSHILQERGKHVSSLEISGKACLLMQESGIKRVLHEDIFQHKERYDSLLLMMNGIGISGDIAGLKSLLAHLKTLLNHNGQILLDSSDISYLYKRKMMPSGRYYGEVSYQYEWRGKTGPWFKWLYIDQDLLEDLAAEAGFKTDILLDDGMDQYLARLTIN